MKLFHKIPIIFILNFLFPFDGDTHDFFLPNGMKVIFMEKNMKSEVSLGIYYNVGSKYEEVGQKGLNRILGDIYHNIRKENYQSKELKTEHVKTFFTKDITGFVNEIDKKGLHSALKIESDLMQTYVNNINEDLIDRSKNIIKQKIKDSDSNPIGRYSFSILPPDHPYYHSLWGLENHFDTLSIASYQKFYKNYYSPNNAVLILVGDFNIQDAAKQVFDNFANINSSKYLQPELDYNFEISKDKKFITKETDEYIIPFAPIQFQLTMTSFYLPSTRNKQVSIIKCLKDILNFDIQNEQKYFKKITNKQKNVIAYFSSYNSRVGYTFYDLVGFNVGNSKSKAKKFKKSVINTFQSIAKNGIDEDLLLKYKKKELKKFYIESYKSYNSINWNLAFSELILGDYKYHNRNYEIIRNLTNNDIKSAVTNLLNAENLFVQNLVVGKSNLFTFVMENFARIIKRLIPVHEFARSE